jgi:type VI secretion system secreted protein Hcp
VATDYFLQISGIPGESLDSKHKDWIDVLSWSWGEATPVSPGAGTGAGAAKVHFSEFNFATRVSKASPALFLACASGQHIKEAKLVGRRLGSKGQQQDFLTWTFSDVLVSNYQTGGSEGDDTPVDSVALNATRVQVTYSGVSPPVSAGWDSKKNAKI